MKILFLAPRHPYPTNRGDQRRVFHLVEELIRRATVTLVCFGEGDFPAEPVRLIALGRSPVGTAVANVRHPSPLLPLQTRIYLDQEMTRAVKSELADGGYDVIHATTARLAAYLPPPTPGLHRHLDLIDALSINMQSRASGERGIERAAFRMESALLRRFEASAVAAADTSSLVSDGDRRAVPGLERAAVIPNGVDSDHFRFVPLAGRPPVLLFFGNLGYFHNIEPARFVAREVLPLIRAQLPEARLRIAGARPAKAVLELNGLPGVDVVGPISDMAEELSNAAVALVPMFTGSGIKNKVLEAFSTGTPVVTNALGIGGVDGAKPGYHYLEGEDPIALAAACVTAIRDRERAAALAAAGRALVENDYTWSAQAERLIALYKGGDGR